MENRRPRNLNYPQSNKESGRDQSKLNKLYELGILFLHHRSTHILIQLDLLVTKHKPFSSVVLLLFPEQLLAFPPGVFVFLSFSLHVTCQKRKTVL